VQTDDIGLIWLRDRRQMPAVVKTLGDNLSCNAPGICADGPQAYILYRQQLAPTILRLLDIDPNRLHSVQVRRHADAGEHRVRPLLKH
jgi:hypothetical protein